MRIEQYASEKQEEWDNFVTESKNQVFQFYRNYMEYHSDRFTDHSLLFYDDANKLIGLLPASIKDGVLASHGGLTFGGIITNSKIKQHELCKMIDMLKIYMKEQHIHCIIYKTIPHIYHLQPAEDDIYALYQAGAKIDKIECSTVVNLFDRLKMPKGRKAQISRAKREGVTVVESEEYSTFIDLENTVLIEHHNVRAVHTGVELEMLHDRFPENIKLYVGLFEGNIIAGTVVYIYKNVVHTQYMASSEKGREIGALDLVIATVMDLYNDKNWFDFGKSTENDGKFLNKGLISQKEGFGGRTFVYQTWRVDAND